MTKELNRNIGEETKQMPVHDDAVTSAASSMAAWFLRENIGKGMSLKIPKLKIILYPDGSEGKMENANGK